ncbi:protein kinase [Nocardioides sp. W3-2-3]|uniref:protein kinase domain-containing protein n=1 Tax=Nocardioides convexus TaxID=2712224 RepID=UPI0024187E84|nr:protein kinase [Nocardioides convexus]NHA01703.1 protein kinase [Nocardioides convexus]
MERATDDVAPRVTGFEVLARVGADPSGPVLRAREIATGQVVALRRMSRAEGASVASRLADLVHLEEEHVVAVRGLVREPSAAYLVTEWVEAATLAEVMGSGERMVVGQMLGIVRGVLIGLAHVHEHGLAHGGVGPTRVLLDSDGRARLMDTGVVADASLVGDVRDAAALLVLLLTGQPVPPGTAVDKRRLRRVDAALRPVLLRALAVDPGERPADAAALLAGLGRAARRAYGASLVDRGRARRGGRARAAPPGTAHPTARRGARSAGPHPPPGTTGGCHRRGPRRRRRRDHRRRAAPARGPRSRAGVLPDRPLLRRAWTTRPRPSPAATPPAGLTPPVPAVPRGRAVAGPPCPATGVVAPPGSSSASPSAPGPTSTPPAPTPRSAPRPCSTGPTSGCSRPRRGAGSRRTAPGARRCPPLGTTPPSPASSRSCRSPSERPTPARSGWWASRRPATRRWSAAATGG